MWLPHIVSRTQVFCGGRRCKSKAPERQTEQSFLPIMPFGMQSRRVHRPAHDDVCARSRCLAFRILHLPLPLTPGSVDGGKGIRAVFHTRRQASRPGREAELTERKRVMKIRGYR